MTRGFKALDSPENQRPIVDIKLAYCPATSIIRALHSDKN